MVLPRRLARFMHRGPNKVAVHVVPWLPGFGVVEHVGRRSGRSYRTPVNAFRRGGTYVFALTYGRDAQWVRNVLAAGGCRLIVRGRPIRLTNPHLGTDPEHAWAPAVVRFVLGRIQADDYLRLDQA